MPTAARRAVTMDIPAGPVDDGETSSPRHPAGGEDRVHEPEPQAIRAAAAGDIAAFEQLVRSYQAPVWRFLGQLVGDNDLAEDLTQETFVRAYRRLGDFRFEAKFSTWLFRIARNIGIDALRQRGRQAALVSRLTPGAPGASPELHSEVTAAVLTLSPKLREALLLVEVVGLSCAEAAVVLEIPAGTVKSRLFLARRQLVGWFSAGEEDAREV